MKSTEKKKVFLPSCKSLWQKTTGDWVDSRRHLQKHLFTFPCVRQQYWFSADPIVIIVLVLPTNGGYLQIKFHSFLYLRFSISWGRLWLIRWLNLWMWLSLVKVSFCTWLMYLQHGEQPINDLEKGDFGVETSGYKHSTRGFSNTWGFPPVHTLCSVSASRHLQKHLSQIICVL